MLRFVFLKVWEKSPRLLIVAYQYKKCYNNWLYRYKLIVMIIKSIIRHSFCRQNDINNHFTYQQLIQHKWKLLTKYSRRYASEEQFQHQDKFYEQHVYGHPCFIAAVTQHAIYLSFFQIFTQSNQPMFQLIQP